MSQLPERYMQVSKDIVSDIFYLQGISNRGRVTIIRQYAELLCRVLLDANDHFYLGKFEKRLDNEIPNALFKEELVSAVENITLIGNSAAHLEENLKEISNEDVESILNSINFLISYLFVNYFSKYKFGTNGKAMATLSLLPPFIRVNILELLYDFDKNNIAVIDKLCLAILKSEGENKVREWLEENKEILERLSAAGSISKPPPFKQEIAIKNAPKSMYHSCLEKIESLKNQDTLYKDFEEAKSYYKEMIDNTFIEDSEIKELISLMDLIYSGRIAY